MVEPHDECLTDPQRRRSQVAAGSHDSLREDVIIGSILLHIVIDKLLPPCNQHSMGRPCQRDRLIGIDAKLLGIDKLPAGRVISQELLGSFAGCSAVAMIPPIDLLHRILQKPAPPEQR